MHYEIMWEPNGIYCRCHGSASGADISRYLNDIAANPAFESFHYRITDARALSHLRLTPEELRWTAVAGEIHAYRNQRMLEVLVCDDRQIRDTWRQLVSVSRNPHRFADFTSLAAARAWIDAQLATAAAPSRRP